LPLRKHSDIEDSKKMESKNSRLTGIMAWIDARIELDILHSLFLKSVLRKIPLKRNSRVIDIGCGTGWTCRNIAKISTEGKIAGIDISEKVITRARNSSHPDLENLEYIVADAGRIPAGDNHFDFAIAFVSFSWWKNPDATLEEINRVLRRGGKLYVLDIYDKGLGSIFVRISNCFLSQKEKIYPAEKYNALMERVFSDVCQKKVDPFGWGLLTVGTKR